MKYRWSPLTLATLSLLFACIPALACLWDSDTLRTEAKGLPGIAEIITGRFERNPPLYYEMRLERVSKVIAENPDDLAAYDDAGVACDRLGRSDEAIDWMARKRVRLDLADTSRPDVKDHLYRYHANLGTILAHRWFRAGSDRADLQDLTDGRDHIEAAIAINPDAHFGRERYQLMVLQWAATPPAPLYPDEYQDRLPTFLDLAFGSDAVLDHNLQYSLNKKRLQQLGFGDAAEGLAGLVALGSAWESIDVFYALKLALSDRGDASVGRLAQLRCLALIKEGHHSVHPGATDVENLVKGLDPFLMDTGPVDRYYAAACTAATRWHDERTKFMLSRLDAGRHPDTDPTFWDGYMETPAPSMPNGFFGLAGEELSRFKTFAIVLPTGISIGILLIYLRRLRTRQLAKGQSPQP